MLFYVRRPVWTGVLTAVATLVCGVPGAGQEPNPPRLSAAAPHAPVKLTLLEALALAEKNDPNLLGAASDALSAEEDRRQAKAALLPSVSGRSDYLGTEGNGKIPSGRYVTNDGVHVYRDWAVVHQDLSPGALTRTAVKRATVAEAIARAKVEIARRGLAATVTRAYYAMVVAERKYATAQLALQQAQRSLQVSQELEKGREVAHSDVVKSQLTENAQQQAVQEAKWVTENTRLDLAVLLFRDFDDQFTVVDDLDTASSLPPMGDIEALAGNSNPSLAAAIEAVRASEIDTKIARQALLPALTIDAVYGIEANAFALHSTVAAFKDAGPLPNLGYFITASLTVPIWDWGTRRSKIRQSELKQKQAAVGLSVTQRTLVRSLRGFYDEAQVARQQMELQKKAVDLANENLRLMNLRYRAGESTMLELVDAQSSVIQAHNAQDDGLARYRLAIANLQSLTGSF